MGRRRINTLRSCRRTFRQRPKDGVRNVPESSRPTRRDLAGARENSQLIRKAAPANDNWDIFWDWDISLDDCK
jgi:hypothetical protein